MPRLAYSANDHAVLRELYDTCDNPTDRLAYTPEFEERIYKPFLKRTNRTNGVWTRNAVWCFLMNKRKRGSSHRLGLNRKYQRKGVNDLTVTSAERALLNDLYRDTGAITVDVLVYTTDFDEKIFGPFMARTATPDGMTKNIVWRKLCKIRKNSRLATKGGRKRK